MTRRINTLARCMVCGSGTRLIGTKADKRAYVRCESCDTVQLDPVPTSEELKLLYSEEYTAVGYQLPAEILKKVRSPLDRFSLKLLREYCPHGHILEIGPGNGFFMDKLRLSNIECSGLEPSGDYYKLLCEKGLDVKRGFIEDLPEKDWKVSGVYMANVFEHLNDPSEALSCISSVLATDGCIVMSQPTAYLGPYLGRIIQIFTRSPHIPDLGGWLASPYHICLISPRGMQQLCERLGLILIAVYPTPTEGVTGIGRLPRILMDVVNRIGAKVSMRWPLIQSHHFVIGFKART